jgi:hypothetical protein
MKNSDVFRSRIAKVARLLRGLSQRVVWKFEYRWIVGGLSVMLIGAGIALWGDEHVDVSDLTYTPLPNQVYETTMNWALPELMRSQPSKIETSSEQNVVSKKTSPDVVAASGFLSHWEKLPSIAWLAARIPTRQLDFVARNQRTLDSTVSRTRVGTHLSERYKVEPDFMHTLVTASHLTAKEVGLDPLLILAVAAIESNFVPTVQSPAGAKGLMQIMVSVHRDKLKPFGGEQAAFNPYANMKIGALILKDCLARAGSLDAGLRMYVGASNSSTEGGYGRKVLLEYFRLRELATGLPIPPQMTQQAVSIPIESKPSSAVPKQQMTAAVQVVYPPPIVAGDSAL